MLHAYLAPILAQQTPTDPQSYQAVGWIIVSIGAILGIAHYGVQIWRALFPAKHPPDHEVYATKAEMMKLEAAHLGEMKRIEKRFEEWLEARGKQHQETMAMWQEWRQDLQKWQLTIERALGHVETKADNALSKANQGRKA